MFSVIVFLRKGSLCSVKQVGSGICFGTWIVLALAACGPQKVDVNLKSCDIELSANSVSGGNVVFHLFLQ